MLRLQLIGPHVHRGALFDLLSSPLALVHPRLAHPVLPHAALLVQLHVPGVSGIFPLPVQTGSSLTQRMCSAPRLQRGVQDVQRGHGLPDGGCAHLELWCGGDDLHPLEGAPGAAAGLPHPHQRPHGPGLHQVPPRVVRLGHPGRHLCLRWVGPARARWWQQRERNPGREHK